MQCLTIHQPFAHLIVTPQSELPEGAVHKRVENRRWRTAYRGPLLIHAGQSLSWMRAADWPPISARGLASPYQKSQFPEFVFGAIVGVVTLEECVHIRGVRGRSEWIDDNWPWIRRHVHATGTWCWILKDARKFAQPIKYRGQQGLYEVPDHVVSEQMRAVGVEV